MNALQDLPHLTQVLEEYAVAVRNQYQDNLILKDKIASGELLNSVDIVIGEEGSEYYVALNLQDYWKYVEKGRRPGKFPPVNAILSWIRVKPVLPTPNADGSLPTPEQLAFLIGRSIAKNGIQPTNALSDAIKEVRSTDYIMRIREALREDIGEYYWRVIRA